MSDEDFQVVHDALQKVMTPFSNDEVADVLKAERAAWKIVQRYAPEVTTS